MTPTRRQFAALSLVLPFAAGRSWAAPTPPPDPLVIARGAGGDAPEGSRAAYDQAIADGADVLATTIVISKDAVPLALPDNELSACTDIAARPAFSDRRGSRFVDGVERAGWFAEDFTLAELRTLALGRPDPRARRPGPPILTFEDLIGVARAGCVRTARVIGVQAFLPHSAYFAGLGLALEAPVAAVIRSQGYNAPAAAMFVASGDAAALKALGELTRARRVRRLGPAELPDGLAAIRAHAEVIAADPGLLLDLSSGKAAPPTGLIAQAHAAGLAVQAWTGGPGQVFPPPPYRPGDARRLLTTLFGAGSDAVCGDLASPIVRARSDALPPPRD